MVDIIPKKDTQLPNRLTIIFYAAIGLVVFCLIAFFILNNAVERTKKNLIIIEQSLAEEGRPANIALEKEVLKYQSKIEKFAQLMGQHLKTSKVFVFLQDLSHPQILFTEFNFDSSKGQLTLSGTADNFTILNQQLLIFKEEPLMEEVNLTKVLMADEGQVNFAFLLLLSPEVFK